MLYLSEERERERDLAIGSNDTISEGSKETRDREQCEQNNSQRPGHEIAATVSSKDWGEELEC